MTVLLREAQAAGRQAQDVGLASEAADHAERAAAQAQREARALEERLAEEKASGQTRGQAYVAEAATVLAKAKEAAEEVGRALIAWREAEQKAAHVREYLAPRREESWLGRRRLGFTSKELEADIKTVTSEVAELGTAASRAATAADEARDEAWKLVRDSAFAGQFRDLGADKPAPKDIDSSPNGSPRCASGCPTSRCAWTAVTPRSWPASRARRPSTPARPPATAGPPWRPRPPSVGAAAPGRVRSRLSDGRGRRCRSRSRRWIRGGSRDAVVVGVGRVGCTAVVGWSAFHTRYTDSRAGRSALEQPTGAHGAVLARRRGPVGEL